jgi:hypothetical protein
MSSDEGLARMKADSDRQTDALLALMADVDEKQQAALLELAAQSHRVADWMLEYLSERQGEAS